MRRSLWCLLLLGPTMALAQPTIFHVLDPVGPDDTLIVIGEDLGAPRQVEAAYLRGDPGEPGQPLRGPGPTFARVASGGPLLQASARCVKCRLPQPQPDALPCLRLGTAKVVVNRATPWWLQGDRGPVATPGGTLTVCGKSLRRLAKPALVTLLGPQRRRLTGEGDAYRVATSLPADLAPGAYQVYVHNGCGGQLGWSEPLPLTVQPAIPVPARASDPATFGVEPNSPHDQAPALQAALAKAGAEGGGTVRLPRGRFRCGAGLTVPRGVTLQGAGAALTMLYWEDLPKPPEALISGPGHFRLADFTVYAGWCKHVLACELGDAPLGHVTLERLRVRANGYRGHLEAKDVNQRLVDSLRFSTGGGDTVRLGGPNIKILDCDLYGTGRCLYLHRVRGGLVRGNHFYNGRWGWYCISGSDGLIFEDNRITGADLMSTGGGLNCLDGSTSSQHVLFARNNLELMHGWDREAMTTDAGGGCYYGRAAGADGTRTLLAEDAKPGGRDWAGAGLFILDGRGRGQWRRVVRVEPRAITVDRPWDVAPDATSVLTCTMFQGRYLFIGNHFSDAGVALQLYGMACEVICDGNVSTRTAGFHNFGMNYQGIQPSWYVQWLNNTIGEGNCYRSGHDNYLLAGEAHLGVFALPPRSDWESCLTLGCVVRGNRLLSNAHIAVGGSDPLNPALATPVVQEVVVEHNVVQDAALGIFVRRAQSGVLLRQNRCERVAEPVRDEVAMVQAAAARRAALAAEPGPLVSFEPAKMQGNKLPDATGHQFHASATGPVVTAPGRAGGTALKLSGQGYLQVDDPPMFDLQAATLSLWLKPDTVAGRHGLLAKRFTGRPAPFILSLWDGAIEFEATDVAGRWSFNFRTPALLKAGEWSHVAAVLEPGKGVTLYVHGKVAAVKENALARVGNEDALYIGREAWNGVNMQHEPCFYDGLLQDIRLWCRALSAAEVARLAQ